MALSREKNNTSIKEISGASESLRSPSIALYQKVENEIKNSLLNQKNKDVVRFYLEVSIQDSISDESFESIEEIWELAKKDEELNRVLESVDFLVGEEVSKFEKYDLAELREEYSDLWKIKNPSEEEEERISLILKLAATDTVVGRMVEDVDRAFLASNYFNDDKNIQAHKDCMSIVLETIGRKDGVEPTIDRQNFIQCKPIFVGRDESVRSLLEKANTGTPVIIFGEGGVGKTSLCKRLIEESFSKRIELSIASNFSNLSTIEELVEEQLHVLGEIPGQSFHSSFSRLKRQLKNQKIGVFIDNLETVLDNQGCFIKGYERYGRLIDFLCRPDTKSITFIASRQGLNDKYNFNLSKYELKGLSLNEWVDFFNKSGIKVNAEDLKWLHRTHLGNAKAMEILCGKIVEDNSFSTINYCLKIQRLSNRIKREGTSFEIQQKNDDPQNLDNLLLSEFEALKAENNYAYKLLIRLACYRYQEKTVNPDEVGLKHLLWDIPESKRYTAIDELLRRALLNFKQGEGYFLHPVIRQEAFSRLLNSDDWELANSMAAIYWSDRVCKITDVTSALQALEAYYHYMAIDCQTSAANVLIQKRKNAFSTNESLARSLYKLGLLMHIEEAIKGLSEETISEHQRAKLRHTLAALSWLKGSIHDAIKHCEKVYDFVDSFSSEDYFINQSSGSQKKLKEVKLNTFLTNGLCYMGLWKLDRAINCFRHVLQLAREINYEKYSPCALFYIAYIYSLSESEFRKEEAFGIANNLLDRWEQDCMPSWLTEYRLYYLGLAFTNLGEFDKALYIHETVQGNSFHSRYAQARTKHLNGLACCHRSMKNLEKALEFHGEAITAFQRIGARIDLAEAFFQQAITFYEIGDYKLCLAGINHAISVFREMKAESQEHRIEQWKRKVGLSKGITLVD